MTPSDRINTCTTPCMTSQDILDINRETLEQETTNVCLCLLCNQEAGENTIECGHCQEWTHFSCGSISNPLIIDDKECICPVCADNLLYASKQPTDNSMNEQGHIDATLSESPQPDVVNRKRSLPDMITPNTTTIESSDGINMGPSPNKQTCPPNNIRKDSFHQNMPEETGARSKQKKQPTRQK
ncbi:unnamed protein product [Mytilus coruscus]|uniref:Zinc finger PHD-type domain-containing protein n=1 Tax=Mytilus coruscus TaxID=42192 RepID=A0A6J8AFM0_MYTCO|nr:unnamed protein product [Mytilus coruscus]